MKLVFSLQPLDRKSRSKIESFHQSEPAPTWTAPIAPKSPRKSPKKTPPKAQNLRQVKFKFINEPKGLQKMIQDLVKVKEMGISLGEFKSKIREMIISAGKIAVFKFFPTWSLRSIFFIFLVKLYKGRYELQKWPSPIHFHKINFFTSFLQIQCL